MCSYAAVTSASHERKLYYARLEPTAPSTTRGDPYLNEERGSCVRVRVDESRCCRIGRVVDVAKLNRELPVIGSDEHEHELPIIRRDREAAGLNNLVILDVRSEKALHLRRQAWWMTRGWAVGVFHRLFHINTRLLGRGFVRRRGSTTTRRALRHRRDRRRRGRVGIRRIVVGRRRGGSAQNKLKF